MRKRLITRCLLPILATSAAIAFLLGSATALADNGGDIGDGGEAEAGLATDSTGRLHVIQYNVCDQYQVAGKYPCDDNSPGTRATVVKSVMTAFGAHVGTFQEMCRSTYNSLLSQLGAGWNGYFYPTVTVPLSRCLTSQDWGVAFVMHGGMSSPYVKSLYPYGAERRVLICGNTTITSGFRVCSTHLDPSDPQIYDVSLDPYSWARDGDATLIGGDFNLSVRWPTCDPYGGSSHWVNRMIPMYYQGFGQKVRACGWGSNYYYEADNRTTYGDGTYEEYTNLNQSWKYDYIFANAQRFFTDYGGDATHPTTSISDHEYLKGALTLHS